MLLLAQTLTTLKLNPLHFHPQKHTIADTLYSPIPWNEKHTVSSVAR